MKNNLLPSLKQQALLTYIDGFIKENNYAPSYREVMRALDYKSVSTVASHIDGLITRGWLVKRDNSARSVEVLYKEGQSNTAQSPTPSLPDSHEEWLKALAEVQLADPAKNTAGDRSNLVRTLRWLELNELADEFDQAA